MAELSPHGHQAGAVKRLATLTAQFALHGFEVREVDSGFLVTRWHLAKHFSSFDDLQRFGRVVGAV